jgi:hypothetical protein
MVRFAYWVTLTETIYFESREIVDCTMFVSFRKPQQANDSIMEDDGNIYHYRDDELVGVTVLNASRKTAPEQR